MNQANTVTSPAWYVVHTKPKEEDRALEQLQNQSFDCFLPKIRDIRRRATGRVTMVGPLFPRYLFIHLIEGVHTFAKVRSTRGCIDLVRFNGLPAKVPQQWMSHLLDDFSQHENGIWDVTKLPTSKLSVGGAVEVLEGPLAGLVGKIAEIKPQDRFVVLLEIMGAERKVELDGLSLEKVQLS